jgi:hypothetical protein
MACQASGVCVQGTFTDFASAAGAHAAPAVAASGPAEPGSKKKSGIKIKKQHEVETLASLIVSLAKSLGGCTTPQWGWP